MSARDEDEPELGEFTILNDVSLTSEHRSRIRRVRLSRAGESREN